MGVKGTASARSAQTCACSTLGSYKLTMAFSARKSRKRVIAGDSRVSPVSALNANPRTAIRYRARQLHSHKRPKQTEGYFASDRVEKRVHHALREPPLLILIQLHDLSPVGCDFRQMKTFAEIHQVQDVLLEARSAETNGSFEEFGSDAGIETNSVRNLVDIRACGFTNCGQRVDRRDSLGQHCVCSQLGKFG